jgi:hypothetical protein
MVTFECNQNINNESKKWIGHIQTFTDQSNFYEIKVDSNGADIHIIFGNGKKENFICLPEYGVGCGVRSFEDTGRIFKKLEPLIGDMKASVVAHALNKMSEILF